MEVLTLIGSVLGGLGLFLLAIGMMTDGLKLAAGSALRRLLSEWSATPIRGVVSGSVMTAIVQSSSAITVASLGFVNAGLLNMRQALGIIYGANIGTTMTGWLVAVIGFNFKIQAFALPMIGIGMFIKLIKQNGQAASFGVALVGFGVFFIGIDVLKSAFEGLVQTFDITRFTAEGISGIFIFLCLGIIMTIFTQSSSASIALTITAASSGMVGLYAAGAMVIGANIGTTSTALFAAIGATSPAKRVATAQVIFNATTGIVALTVLPILFFLITFFCNLFGIEADPAISLALFHTLFNVLGVMLIFPHNDRLAAFLESKFQSREETQYRPRFLDNTIAQTPVLAVNALTLESLSLIEKIVMLYGKIISAKGASLGDVEHDAKIIQTLLSDTSSFIVNIEQSALSEETTVQLATLMRIAQYLMSCTHTTERLAIHLKNREPIKDYALETELRNFLKHVLNAMREMQKNAAATDQLFIEYFNKIKFEYDQIKEKLILEATRSHIPIPQMTQSLDCLAETLEIVESCSKALMRLKPLEFELNSGHEGRLEEIKNI